MALFWEYCPKETFWVNIITNNSFRIFFGYQLTLLAFYVICTGQSASKIVNGLFTKNITIICHYGTIWNKRLVAKNVMNSELTTLISIAAFCSLWWTYRNQKPSLFLSEAVVFVLWSHAAAWESNLQTERNNCFTARFACRMSIPGNWLILHGKINNVAKNIVATNLRQNQCF